MQRVDYNRYSVEKGRSRRRAKSFSKTSKVLILLAVFISIFVGFRIITMEADVSLTTTFVLPDGVSLENVGKNIKNVKWAAAVDGKVVAGNDKDKVQATASTTKMILALAVLEKKPIKNGEKGETITITKEMYDKYGWYLSHNGSNSRVKVNEKISEYDALVSIMLVSSNNMADSLAIWAFGSISEYRKYATEMLKKWGIKDTVIGEKDASGYDEGTVSTASDLAKIGYIAMKNSVLAEIVGKQTADVPVAGKLTNTNKLLGKSGISGIKTGYIGDPSGYCIVSAYKDGEHIITVSLLDANTRDDSFEKNLAIVKDLQGELVEIEMIKRGDEIGYYDAWWIEKVPIKTEEGFSEINYKGLDEKIEVDDSELKIMLGEKEYIVVLNVPDFPRQPNLLQRFLHVFGWEK